MSCNHPRRSPGLQFGFAGPVFTQGKTRENKAAHGGVTFQETCDACGAYRSVNRNGDHSEVSAWSLSLAERLAGSNL